MVMAMVMVIVMMMVIVIVMVMMMVMVIFRVFNRPGVAGAVLQTHLSIIKLFSLTKSFCQNIFKTPSL